MLSGTIGPDPIWKLILESAPGDYGCLVVTADIPVAGLP